VTLPLTVAENRSLGRALFQCSHVDLGSCQNQRFDKSLFAGANGGMR